MAIGLFVCYCFASQTGPLVHASELQQLENSTPVTFQPVTCYTIFATMRKCTFKWSISVSKQFYTVASIPNTEVAEQKPLNSASGVISV